MKKFFTLVVTALLLLTLWGAYRYEPELFPIVKVKVKGDLTHVSKQHIVKVVTPFLDAGFFSISLRKVTKELKEHPWVKQVDAKRRWPDALVLNIDEREIFAMLDNQRYIDEDGNVFKPKTFKVDKKLPYLSGPIGEERQLLQQYKKMSKILTQVSLSVAGLRVDRAMMKLNLTNSMTIILSLKSAMKQLERFVNVYPVISRGKKKKMALVDLRYRHGMAVQWK